jgi:hypothetical protein
VEINVASSLQILSYEPPLLYIRINMPRGNIFVTHFKDLEINVQNTRSNGLLKWREVHPLILLYPSILPTAQLSLMIQSLLLCGCETCNS